MDIDTILARLQGEPATVEAEQARGPVTLEAAVTLDLVAAEGDGARLPRFEMIANTGTPMRPNGWRHPVVMDFSGMAIPSQSRPIRMGHDSGQGVGHTDYVGFEGGKLVARGVISRETPAARDVVSAARNGFPWQASIGASLQEVEFIKEGEAVNVNGRQFSGPLNVARKSTLGEISFVDLGADGNTSVQVAAEASAVEENEVQSETTTAAATATASAASNNNGQSGEVAAALAEGRAEHERQDAIRAMGAQYLSLHGVDTAAVNAAVNTAITEGKTVKAAVADLIRASRPKAPAVHRVAAPTPLVLEAAMCLSNGVSDEHLAKDPRYGGDVVNAAYGRRRMGLHDLMAAALEAQGVHAPRRGAELLTTVLDNLHVRAEGFSTVNLPGILGNVANKVLLTAFLNIEVTYDRIAEQADFNNFHTHTLYRLEALGSFEKVAKDGELKNGNLGQDSATNKLETSGMLIMLTRQDIINDDLNAFRTLNQQIGRKARIAVEKSLYAVIMEASDVFYTTGTGNRLVGALSTEALAASQAALLKMADSGGDPIYASPRFILVPPELSYLAEQFYTSDRVLSFITSKTMPTDNPFKGRFEPVTSPFLSATSLTGYSATTWYMLANPLYLPAFQVAYLDGRRAPTIETSQAEFNVLGMAMRCYFDWGVAQIDGRGAIKNTAS